MPTNLTNIKLTSHTDVTVVFSLFLTCVSISIILSFGIILLIIFTKPLHSSMNLLVCNTCLDTILYIIMTIINMSLFYFEIRMSNWRCRIQAYLHYVALNLVAYSYFIQALSRLFYTVFYKKRFLLNYKSHIILIICQTIFSFILSLPSIVTKDIIYRPRKLCLIPMKHIYHVCLFLISVYGILLFSFIIIYTIIYRKVTRSTSITRRSSRDIELIRNIFIMFMIYASAGAPGVIYTVVSSINNRRTIPSALYMLIMAATPMATLVEKISLIYLNKEIRKGLRNVLNKFGIFQKSNQTNIKLVSYKTSKN